MKMLKRSELDHETLLLEREKARRRYARNKEKQGRRVYWKALQNGFITKPRETTLQRHGIQALEDGSFRLDDDGNCCRP